MMSLKQVLLGSLAVVALTGCAVRPQTDFNSGDPVMSQGKKDNILNAVRNEALERKFDTLKKGEFVSIEKNYTDNPKSPEAALDYARMLRQVDMAENAKLILKPFAIDTKTASEDVLLEYSKIQLALGDFDTAQIFAQEAVFANDGPEENMILGVSLDAQGHHDAAEEKLRQALDVVGLDIELRNKVLNNLAVSLLSQGKTVEAKETLALIDNGANSNDSELIVDGNRKLVSEL